MNLLKVWILPMAVLVAFLSFLLLGIPYSTGYGWDKISLGSMAWTLWHLTDWQHAAFVPLICLFLVYLQRNKIRQAPIQGSNWAFGLILFGLFFYCVGLKAEMQYFGFFAIQVLLAGLILWLWGPKVFRLVGFAWLFLVFTWPMPFLDGMVALPLRLVMSHVSTGMLNLLGTPCIQSGTAVLSAPDAVSGLKMGERFQVDIADPCSGLHSLFALMMVSALAGYISMKRTIPRLFIFLASIPLAIAGNVVRIILLVWATEHFGSAFALGSSENPSWFHLGCGYAVYLVALTFLIALITLLNSKWFRRMSRGLSDRLAMPGQSRPESAGGDVTAHPAD